MKRNAHEKAGTLNCGSVARSAMFPANMTTTPVRFGFVGAGQIAHTSVPQVRAHEEGDVVAVTDTNLERAQELSARCEVPTV